MKYSVLLEPIEPSQGMPGGYYAHVPTLGLTTHGQGVEGALVAVKDLIHLWVEEIRESGGTPLESHDAILAAVEVD